MVSFRTAGLLTAMAIPALALPVADNGLQQRQDEVTAVHATFTFPFVQNLRHTAVTSAIPGGPDDINPCAAVLCQINTTCEIVKGQAVCLPISTSLPAEPTVITAEPTIFTATPTIRTPEPTYATTGLPLPPAEGVQCGENVCDAGEVCCNPSCGICTPPNGACIMIFCADGQLPTRQA
jgi:hypothetical protein